MSKKNKAIKETHKSVESSTYVGKPRKHDKKAVRMVNHISKTGVSKSTGSNRVASCYPVGGSFSSGYGRGMGDIIDSSPSFYDPYFEPSTLILPRNLLEINSWCRYFYKYDPYVATAIDMHAELPLSKMRLQPPKSKDKRKAHVILEHYEKMIGVDGIDLYNKLLQIGVEFYKLGNVYPYLQLNDPSKTDDNMYVWEKLTLLDPDYISIDKLQFTNAMKIELIPNDRLKEIINKGDSDPRTGVLSQTIDPAVKEIVLSGRSIPLSTKITESHVSHIARKMGDYEILGTSLIERNFKALVYKDRLRRSQDAIAVRHLTPKHLIYTPQEVKANSVDVEMLREQVENALFDPDYAIVTNFQVNWELVGTNQGLMQVSSEWEWINEELMVGLMLNKSFVMGEGAFANGQTVLEVLEQRYAIYRSLIEDWIETHVFKPIAILNDFTEKKRGFIRKKDGTVEESEVEVLLYPSIKWNRLNLTDDNSHKQMLSQMVERGFLDVETWLDYFGLDSDIIMEKMKKFENTPLDPNYQELQRSIQSEVGRVLGPAIAKVRAEELGLDIASEDEGGFGFGQKYDDKFEKTANIEDMPVTTRNLYQTMVNDLTNKIMNKFSETRDQRKHERDLRKKDRNKEDSIKNLELDIHRKNKFPKRKDLTNKAKPELFAENEDNDLEIIKESDIVKKKPLEGTKLSSEYFPVEREL